MKRLIYLPMQTFSPNVKEHYHARGRRVKQERYRAKIEAALAGVKKLGKDERITVTFTRVSQGTLDKEENLPMAFKAIKDGIADALKLGKPNKKGHYQDNDERVTWQYDQALGGKGKWWVLVEIEGKANEGL